LLFVEGSTNERQAAVVAAFRHAWKGYKKYAWGHDHLKPITGTFHDWFSLGLTIVDALDTIYIMGLKEGKALISSALHQKNVWVGCFPIEQNKKFVLFTFYILFFSCCKT
jgi:hypothetical protein